ncbi:MAG: cytochrome b/b6 domain-containing protein [Hyphomicrobiaceae bacterium]
MRIFHWSLVILFAFAWATEDHQSLHQPVGYAILGLLALRIVWGVVGSRYARFADFIRSPRTVLSYARDLVSGRALRSLGHNPMAGMMVLALMAMLMATGTSGWLIITDAYRSAQWLEEAHEALASLTPGLVAVHVAAVLVMSVWHGEKSRPRHDHRTQAPAIGGTRSARKAPSPSESCRGH